jgi:hypothetical protein
LTIRLLQLGGCLVHENYNQLYPASEAELAQNVRQKDLLGYHDVRTGNEPDARMTRFVSELLPGLAVGARPTFTKFRVVHRAYGKGEMSYVQWFKELKQGTKGWKGAVRDEAKAEGADELEEPE